MCGGRAITVLGREPPVDTARTRTLVQLRLVREHIADTIRACRCGGRAVLGGFALPAPTAERSFAVFHVYVCAAVLLAFSKELQVREDA